MAEAMDAADLCDRLRHLQVRDNKVDGEDAPPANPDAIFQRWRRDARDAQLVMPDSAIITTCNRCDSHPFTDLSLVVLQESALAL